MNLQRLLFVLTLNLSLNLFSSAQPPFSVGTGIAGLRNVSKSQGFWALGQNVQVAFHFSPRQSGYASLDYFTGGSYRNTFTAAARLPQTSPQQLAYTATGRLEFRQVSVGWKHFFRGAYNAETGINVYGTAGFGLLFARVSNVFNTSVDASLYATPNVAGNTEFKRITFDAGLGAEYPLGGTFFAYGTVRGWAPASETRSPLLHNQRNVPAAVIATAGLRILFGSVY